MTDRRLIWLDLDEVAGLLRAAQAGDTHALERLLGRLRPRLVAYLARRVPDADAEDITQLALIRIAGAVQRIDPERADHYFAKIVHNLLRTEHRRRARLVSRFAPGDWTDVIPAPEQRDEHHYEDLVRAVHRVCVAALSPALRDVVLEVLGGHSPAEIATRLHLNPVTIRTRLNRARAILRRELQAFDDRHSQMGTGHRPIDQRRDAE